MSWFAFAVRRLIGLVLVTLGMIVAVFCMIHLVPGDPARSAAGIDASQQQVMALRHALRLDEPLVTQFREDLVGIIHWDLGRSFVTGEPVADIIQQRLPYTLELAGIAFALVLVLGIPLGIVYAGLARKGNHRLAMSIFGVVTASLAGIPEFLAGTFLVLVFAIVIRLLPAAGANSLSSLVLPSLAVALRPAAILARLTFVEARTVLQQQYILAAEAKRLRRPVIYFRHLLPNVITASLTVGGVLLSALLGGTVIVENVFNWPGLGSTVVQSVLARDYPVVEGVVLVLGFGVIVINLLVDVILALVNPRSLVREG